MSLVCYEGNIMAKKKRNIPQQIFLWVFQIVIVLILPKLIGITGVWLSIVLAEFLALFVTIGFLIAKRKKYYYA